MTFTKLYKEVTKKIASKIKEKGIDYRSIYQQRMIEFRKERKSVVRVEKPTNVVRARTLGYKAKQGVFIVRVRVRKGSGLFRPVHKARRPKRHGFKKLTRRISIQRIAEQRASSRFTNAEVINSYWVGEDGKAKYYEVIMADKGIATVKNDKDLSAIVKKTGRAERGLTSAGRKGRGLDKKGNGTEKIRPSIRARKRLAK
jgi:large subunit ribosomal protein L15e